MARKDDKPGCGTIILVVFVLLWSYGSGIVLLGEQRKKWHYLAALPLGLLFNWIVFWGGGVLLAKWLTIKGCLNKTA